MYRALRCTRYHGRRLLTHRSVASRLLGNGKAKPLSIGKDVSYAALHALPRSQALNTSKCSVISLLTAKRNPELVLKRKSRTLVVETYRLLRCTLCRGRRIVMNEWVLIATCKQLVWSTRIGRNMPIWNPLPKCRVSIEGKSGPMRCCHAPGPSVLGAPDLDANPANRATGHPSPVPC